MYKTSDGEADLRPFCERSKQARVLLDVSPAFMAGLLKSGELPSFRAGRARMIPVAGIEEWIARKMATST
jgi:hypothetical protein